ncbi:MAG: cyclic nucleotide-binding domain-containing protein, partial [Solirubrobacteraceae bacterium]
MASTVSNDSLPLLGALPAEVRALTEAAFEERQLDFGDTVVSQGDPADGYYVIVEGSARVLVRGEDGHEVSLNSLGPGDAFGEGALLEGTVRSATVRASGPLKVKRLDRALFLALVERYPEIVTAFHAAAHARRINDFLRLHSAFAALPRDAIIKLIDDLRPVSLGDGEVAVSEGDSADAMYLIEDGRLGVWIGDRRVRTLHAGEFFGELALLRDTPRTATVRAEGDVSLLALDAPGFHALMAEQSSFAQRVDERIALYEARDRRGSEPAPEMPDSGVWKTADPGLAVSEGGEDVTDAAPMPHRRRPRAVRQIDEMDCGAASIAMVCNFFGQDVSMTAIRQAVGTGTEGTTLRGLIRGGEEMGLAMRAVKSSPSRLDSLALPAIIHWDANHWIVLYAVEGDRLRIADPGRGLRTVSRAELAEKWSGYAALAQPTERLADAPRGGLNLRWL